MAGFFFRNKYHRRAMRGDVSGRNYGYSQFLASGSHPWNYVQASAHTALHQLIEYLPWLLPWKEVPYQHRVHGRVKRTTTRGVIWGVLWTFKLVGSILLHDRLILARILTTIEAVSSLHAASIDVNIKNSKMLDRSFLYVNIHVGLREY
jgi:hypothetical protein